MQKKMQNNKTYSKKTFVIKTCSNISKIKIYLYLISGRFIKNRKFMELNNLSEWGLTDFINPDGAPTKR